MPKKEDYNKDDPNLRDNKSRHDTEAKSGTHTDRFAKEHAEKGARDRDKADKGGRGEREKP